MPIEQHPLQNYYLKLDDLSVNSIITLKWIKWGFFFIKSLSDELNSIEDNTKDLIKYSINNSDIADIKKSKHILLLDNNEVDSEEQLDGLIKNLYSHKIFDENTKIHFKLKINLSEFLIITHISKPSLIFVEEN